MTQVHTDTAGSGHYGPAVPPGVTTVLELIDRQVAARPLAPAVVEAARSVSYAELDRLADQAAAALAREREITRGDVVLIAAQAGVDFTAAVLGTLRAGAAYLPVDLGYPAQRLAEILAASRARLFVLGEGGGAAPSRAGTVPLRQLFAGDYPGRSERPALAGDDAAYVIFTSGSTGTPKGIVQTHRCLSNFISWQVEDSGLGVNRRVLQTSPLTFDVSVQEVFFTLASGGSLHVPGAVVKEDPRDLVDFLIDHQVEVVDFPQSLIDVVMTLPRTFEDAPDLKHVISAGEAVRISPAMRSMLTRRRDITLHNHYGPAENHMVTSHSMSADRGNLEASPPVGALVRNTYIRILDDDGRPVPDGEHGEVYIGGVGLARGYTDPALTPTTFVADPCRPGARLYRTRDRGFWREDGVLRLLGRIDHLIKVRGYSVEPSEVERHLAECPGVTGALVFGAARGDKATELNAVLTGVPGSPLELRQRLLSALPDYMVPARWWVADSLPRSPNGKLDRSTAPGHWARPLSATHHASD